MKRLQLRLSRRLLDNMTNMVMSWMTEGAGKLALVSVLLITQGKKDNQLNQFHQFSYAEMGRKGEKNIWGINSEITKKTS